jgi:hypothetical protein
VHAVDRVQLAKGAVIRAAAILAVGVNAPLGNVNRPWDPEGAIFLEQLAGDRSSSPLERRSGTRDLHTFVFPCNWQPLRAFNGLPVEEECDP